MGDLENAIKRIGSNLGIDNERLTEGGEGSVTDVMLDWANEVIEELRQSLRREISTGTSKDLEQSMVARPRRTAEQFLVEISMLDYYDFTNKGVEGIGGVRSDNRVWVKKPTFGTYSYKSSPIKIDNSLRQWANAKGLSEYALSYSIAHQGIEGTLWYDNVVTPEIFEDLANRIAKSLG